MMQRCLKLSIISAGWLLMEARQWGVVSLLCMSKIRSLRRGDVEEEVAVYAPLGEEGSEWPRE